MSDLKITCPNCGLEINTQSPDIIPKCSGMNCEYKIKFFYNDAHAAKEFYLTEPSKKRKYLLKIPEANWIVAFCEKAEPFRVENLFDLIEPKALQTIQVGLSHRFKKPMTIIVKFDKEPKNNGLNFPINVIQREGKIFGRLDLIDPYFFYCKHCLEIRNTDKGKKECIECDLKNAMDMINSGAPVSKWYICWSGLVDFAIPVVINEIVTAIFFTGQIRWIDPEGEKELGEGSERVSKLIPTLTKEKLLIFADDEKQEKADENKLEELKKECEALVETIRHVADDKYWIERRAKETEFLSEVCSFFATVEDEETLWKVLEVVFRRINEFLDLSHTAFLLNDSEFEEKYSIKVVAGFNSDRVLKIDKEQPEINFETENLFSIKEAGKIINQELYKKIKNLLGINEFDYGFVFSCILGSIGKGLILTVNYSKKQNNSMFKTKKEFIEQIAHEISLEIQNALTINELRKTLREKDDLMATAAHLLVAPLDTTFGKTEHLVSLVSRNDLTLSYRDREIIRDLCYKIDEDIMRAIRQIRSFLFYTTIGTDAEKYRDDKSISLVKLLRELTDSFKYLAQKRGIRIEFNPSENIPEGIFDKDKLEMAFSNIIDNAIKYSHINKKVILNITFDKKDDTYNISISDFGVGIPPEEQEKIFKKYHRSEFKDPRRFVPGTGIGLNVVKQIVKKYNGEVWVTSKQGLSLTGKESSTIEGYNTTFWIKLPKTRSKEYGEE
jgi:signal transduction histidine kinase/ligand-binding sensor protein